MNVRMSSRDTRAKPLIRSEKSARLATGPLLVTARLDLDFPRRRRVLGGLDRLLLDALARLGRCVSRRRRLLTVVERRSVTVAQLVCEREER